MGLGTFAKTTWASLAKNKAISQMVASGTMKSVGRWAMAGGAIGGIGGAARRVMGDRDASITGGFVSGAMGGAGLRSFGYGWKKAFGRNGLIGRGNKLYNSTSAAAAARRGRYNPAVERVAP